MPLWNKDVAAYLTVGASDSAITFTAVPGTAGNNITIAIVTGSGALSVAVVSEAITVTLASGGSTTAAVVAAVNGSTPASALVIATLGTTNGQRGINGLASCPTISITNLAGGEGQSAPNWMDSFAATDGWRSEAAGDLLVAIAENKPSADFYGDAANILYGVIRNNLFGPGEPYHFQYGNVADIIELLIEYDQAVKVTTVAATPDIYTFGSGNSAITFTAVKAGASSGITVTLVASGDNTPLSVSTSGTAVTVNLATNGSAASITTVTQLQELFSLNPDGQVMDLATYNLVKVSTTGNGTGVIVAHSVESLTGGANAVVPTIPITIGENTRQLEYIQPQSFDQSQGYGGLLFQYQVVSGDSATAGNVQIGTGDTQAYYQFGSSNTEVTFTAGENYQGTAGNAIHVFLNAPVSVNNPTLSSSFVSPLYTLNLVTSGGVAATYAFGSGTSEITFTANSTGTAGNSITVVLVASGDNTPLSIGVVSDAITVNLATNGSAASISTVAQVIAAIVASSPASALVIASTTGDGTGVVAAHSVENLATGANASATSTVAQVNTFVATDPNATNVVVSSTTGNGTGTVAGHASQALANGISATASINLNSVCTIVDFDDVGVNANLSFTPPSTSLYYVN